jgi:malate dehydrogenase (oxaloacetate-decarboxylating)(NADP+)
VSAHIACAIAEVAFNQGLAGIARPADLMAFVRERMYEPVYTEYV